MTASYPLRPHVWAKEQRPRQLLADRAAAFGDAPRPHVRDYGPKQAEGVEANVVAKAMVLDCDHGVADVRRHLRQRHIATLLVHGKPRTAVGGVENRVPGTTRERVDGAAIRTPHHAPRMPITSIVVSTGTMTRDSPSFNRGRTIN